MEGLTNELRSLPENFIVAVIMPNDSYEDANIHLLDFLVNEKKAFGCYVAVSKPSHHISNILKNENIYTNRLFFIDCITKGLGADLPEMSNCIFVESPAHLTDLGIALHNFFVSTKDNNKFLYIDSISTLCIHNNLDSVLKFVHYITGKMRIFGFNGLMLSLKEGTNKELISELGQFCDKVIHL